MSTTVVHACPLCERELVSQNHLRCHLHERHRKIEIIDAYLKTNRRPLEVGVA
ncbi:hypothetical protein [Halegenticoccus tardaugens]|uniref:hypothetical protein n=1 Tax=Halegenticoccus tardaugens TaxID=2071624 RepID=UPI0013E96A79|nr:hypothetical protein [Halegenticoccus tardaugens]